MKPELKLDLSATFEQYRLRYLNNSGLDLYLKSDSRIVQKLYTFFF